MNKQPLIYIFVSAALFGISPPLAKLLVKDIPPVALAGFLYFGAFTGLSLLFNYEEDRFYRKHKPTKKRRFPLAVWCCTVWGNYRSNMSDVRIEPDFWFYHLIAAESGRDFYRYYCRYFFQGEGGKAIVAGVDVYDLGGDVPDMGFKPG